MRALDQILFDGRNPDLLDTSLFPTKQGLLDEFRTESGNPDATEQDMFDAVMERGHKVKLLANATVGETVGLAVSLGVRRYNVAVATAAVGDRLILALTGAPQNGTVQDAYVSAAGTVSVGLLVPAIGIGATIAVPLAIYKAN